jgi:predicted N-acyltransferase
VKREARCDEPLVPTTASRRDEPHDLVKWTIARSARDIAGAAWSQLAGQAGLYSSHEWLRAVEATGDAECRYVEVREDGRLVAGMPVYVVGEERNSLYRPDVHLRGIAPAERLCLAGSRSGYRNVLLVSAELTEREQARALATMLDGLASVLAEFRLSSAAFLFLTAESAALTRMAPGFAVPVLAPAAESLVAVHGDSFETDFLGRFPSKRRSTIRREMREFRLAGLTSSVAIEDPWSLLPSIADLAVELDSKYGKRPDGTDYLRALTSQRDELARFGRSITGRTAGGELVGAALAYEWQDRLYLRLGGLDRGRLSNFYEYFNIFVYAPIEYGFRKGLRGVHLGIGSHRAKGLRGASVEPLFSTVWSPRRPLDLDSRYGDLMRRYWAVEAAENPVAFTHEYWNRTLPRLR